MQRTWLVRHGLTQWNIQQRFCSHTDIPLSTSGRAQARWLASQLRAVPLATIYTSDLARSQETAEIIAAKRVHPVEVVTSAAWREIDFGAWEGLTYDEITAAFKDQLSFFTDPEHCAPPGGESLSAVLQRVLPALAEILRSHRSSRQGEIVIVSHGGTLRALLCALLGMPLSNQWQLQIDAGSLNAIDLSPGDHGSLIATLALLNYQRPLGRGGAGTQISRPGTLWIDDSRPVGHLPGITVMRDV